MLYLPLPAALSKGHLIETKYWTASSISAFSPQRFIASNSTTQEDPQICEESLRPFFFQKFCQKLCRNACIFNTISPPLWGHLVTHLSFNLSYPLGNPDDWCTRVIHQYHLRQQEMNPNPQLKMCKILNPTCRFIRGPLLRVATVTSVFSGGFWHPPNVALRRQDALCSSNLFRNEFLTGSSMDWTTAMTS